LLNQYSQGLKLLGCERDGEPVFEQNASFRVEAKWAEFKNV